jgi:hypothetical protein
MLLQISFSEEVESMWSGKLGNFLSINKKNENIDQFNNILEFAQSVIESYTLDTRYNTSNLSTHPIIDVIRLIGRNLQTKYLTQLLSVEDESPLPSLFPETLFVERREFLLATRKRFEEFEVEVNNVKEIQLGKDLILPWPWKRKRLINCIATIGDSRSNGCWKQDFTNHDVVLWLPMGIAWVNGGNHSIAVGIIQCNGRIKPDKVVNISKIYDQVKCDGRYYFNTENGSIICPVRNVEFAAIFEIGRMMRDNSISF